MCADSTESSHPASTLPRHIAIIMDGNGRWATARKKPRPWGHKVGVEAVRRTVELCAAKKIEALTLFAFSSENWRRPQSEVGALMELFLRSLQQEVRKLQTNGVRLRFIGDRQRFAEKLNREIQRAEEATAGNTGLQLNIAANYGGRWDMAHAARLLADEVVAGKRSVDSIDEAAIAGKTELADLPEPDLLIRTGGEQRISNFLLWQLAYTELYFCDVLWPDFSADELEKALRHFETRQRRFGRTGEQMQSVDNA